MAFAASAEERPDEWEQVLPFEREAADAYLQLQQATDDDTRIKCEARFEKAVADMSLGLTPWERVQLARHSLRPRALSYINTLFDDFLELHGDRLQGDDPAIIGGVAQFDGQTVLIIGQEKGVSTEERVQRNFGMSHPSGYRKALRLFRFAERMRMPIITFVDTPAAHPGIEAEESGQGPAIAENLLHMLGLKTPIMTIVIGEGGSGGALGIAVADHVAMLEHAIYVICPPERCAEILWRDVEKKALAASAMRVTARDLKELDVIDAIVQEPGGGAHRNRAAAFENTAAAIREFLHTTGNGEWDIARRHDKFRSMGKWSEAAEPAEVKPSE